MTGAPVTLLFTDLVDSTGLLQRVGDERAQRILHAHRQLLREVLASHGGREVKWLGDGVLSTFASVADGVRCAVTMAQRARRPVAGERLGLRLGLHVGDVLADEADYVGTPVVLARRLCDRATAGQILCSGVVVELLRGRQGFTFVEVGPLALKGFAEPMAGYEVAYRPETGAALLRHTPFTGRTGELRRLMRRLDEARAGQGGVVLVAGEPGIGKTRLLEEVTETARARGALVLWGRCYEGEAARSFGPFAEALTEYVRTVIPAVVRADLGVHASSLLRLVPAIGERLPDVPEPVALEPHEERVRLLDAVAQSLLAMAARVPTVLVLDDLHWADPGTAALLRHVARFAPRARLLVLGAYRDVEVTEHHPVAEALGTLPRETSYEHVALGGLDPSAVNELVSTVVEREVPAAWAAALTRETSGNPFFLREVLLHLEEEGTLRVEKRHELGRLRVPDTVRQVITRRLGRLSPATNQLLQAAAAFTGGIDFEVARRVARLDEPSALDALDEALGAQLLVATAENHTYDFTHALVRHTLYGALSPARQPRLHRQLAEAMEAVYGARAVEHAAEIARHYHRSRTLPVAARGIRYCLAAAEHAERAAAFSELAEHLRAALELFPVSAPERPGILSRLALALFYGRRFNEADVVARDAATQIARTEGPAAAADYLARVARAVNAVGVHGAWSRLIALVRQGLGYAGERRDLSWAVLKAFEIILDQTNEPQNLGIPLDTTERREVEAIFARSDMHTGGQLGFLRWTSRAEIVSRHPDAVTNYLVGDYRRGVPRLRADATENERQGNIARAVVEWAAVSRFHTALGEFGEAREARRHAGALGERFVEPTYATGHLVGAEDEWRLATDEGWDAPVENVGPGLGEGRVLTWYLASTTAAIARTHAHMGRIEPAMRRLASILPAIERAPGWADNYIRTACDAAATLWLTERTDHIEVIERNLRAKVIDPDFRYPMMDGRLSLARLCALQRRWDEAGDWFAKARVVLDEQGARPLRAIVDYDEALMYARRAASGDAARARPLLDAALRQFRTLGMPGWIRRAECLLRDGREWSPVQPAAPSQPADVSAAAPASAVARVDDTARCSVRRSGEFWTVVFEGASCQLKDTRGLQYLARLLAHPGREFHTTELVGLLAAAPQPARRIATDNPTAADLGDAGARLDPTALRQYQRRLTDVREELSEAEADNDLGRAERLRAELELLVAELARAGRRGGRVAAHAERARSAVGKRIRAALQQISAAHPGLGHQINAAVRTGYVCTYTPPPRLRIECEY